MASLFVIRGRDQGSRFDLAAETITLGREATNTIQIHDTEASRRHAELRKVDDGFSLYDLQSSNGTYVNGEEIRERRLKSGDQIQLGRTLMLFTAQSPHTSSELSGKISIVSRAADRDDSQIIHSISQQDSQAVLSGAESPWLARARSNLQIMYRTALAVSHTLDIDQLLSRIMDLIFEWVEADRGCVMLMEGDDRQLTPKVRRDRGGHESDEAIKISQSILDYVTEKNEGVLTSNAQEDSRWEAGGSIMQMGIREAICVPMRGRYDVVGAIYIDTTTPAAQVIRHGKHAQRFTEEHLKLMIAIAHQAALAVEDTSYYKAMVQAERLAAVGQTIATLSHHVKNVLQGIRGGSYLIEMGLRDHRTESKQDQPDLSRLESSLEMVAKGWSIVDKNQDKISTLVLDMLTFSKEREPEPAPTDMNALVCDVIEILQSRAADLEVRLDWQPCSEMPILSFDPDGLHRAVLNVVTNAIDACDVAENACVNVQTEFDEEEKMVRVIVTDNGVGISDEDIPQIFTLFVSRKGGRGTGLGLPVSKKILNEHGGEIRVNSELGRGSCFVLELPAVSPEARSPEDVPAQPATTSDTSVAADEPQTKAIDSP